MNWKKFFTVLGTAAIGGATQYAAHSISEGVTNPKAVGASAVAGALIAVGALFKHSPMEPELPQPPKPEPSADAADETK
jgi:hypothetical protein